MSRKGRISESDERTQKASDDGATRNRAPARRAAGRNDRELQDQRSVDQRGEMESQPFADDRQRRIELAAYYRAERRGFAPGYELQDWLEAEAETD
jgi:hypothetical protein